MVLLYNLASDKDRKIKMIFLKMGIRMKVITKEQYNQKIGYLADIKDFEKEESSYEGTGFTEEMIVMRDFSNKRLDEMLYQFRKAGIGKINLKAVITESNQDWTSLELYEEIRQEHEKMHQ